MKKLLLFLCRKLIKAEAQKIFEERVGKSMQKIDSFLQEKNVKSRVFSFGSVKGSSMDEDLGLTEERTEAIHKELEKHLKKEDTFTLAMEKVSESCHNLQELAYASFRVGTIAAAQRNLAMGGSGSLEGLGIRMKEGSVTMQDIPPELQKKLNELAKKAGIDPDLILKMYNSWLANRGSNPGGMFGL